MFFALSVLRAQIFDIFPILENFSKREEIDKFQLLQLSAGGD